MAYSAYDLCRVMSKEGEVDLTELRVDGGASKNDFLMQFQADVSGCAVDRPTESESTALGAVYLCLIALGIKPLEEIEKIRITEKKFVPTTDRAIYEEYYSQWKKAVGRCIYDEK